MNIITQKPISSVGYDFIPKDFLPKGKDEYYLRNRFNKSGILYRSLTAFEIEILVKNNNTSSNWNDLLVSPHFDPQLVKNCNFFGLVRIGKLEPLSLEFKNLNLAVGLFNSTIISCDFGDNVCIHNVNYLSHYVIGNEVMIANVNELAITNTAKFGNGILKDGEGEAQLVWLEICNENGGRKVLPFDGMLTADAFLWTKYRNDETLMSSFASFTANKFDSHRGHYGMIGDRTVIKNCKMIKDVLIGSDAYIKGANKIKNVTINSSPESPTQIGEGCELVNGIVGIGCRVFYGVKAVRFVMASHSQLKYGARLINSYLGNNATISCCEVLNSLIYPFHEQHHNNSFLCASLLMGQSNMAAGATIGSNHNSRGADGELIAGRGFWPGLCVSLKHNSKFATFSILAKGDFPAELNIQIPFSLIINDSTENELRIIPAYWFLYNFYALQRNEWKYQDRDARTSKELRLEYDCLAPDSINEIFEALRLMSLFTGMAYYKSIDNDIIDDSVCIEKGQQLLDSNDPIVDELEVLAYGFENSQRKVIILKVRKAYAAFKTMIRYYATGKIMKSLLAESNNPIEDFLTSIPSNLERKSWMNIGGQLMLSSEVNILLNKIRIGKFKSWDQVHGFYQYQGAIYDKQLLDHAIACLFEIDGLSAKTLDVDAMQRLISEYVKTNDWIYKGIVSSREKDMKNPFRQMVYDNENEMFAVLGKVSENSFIKQKDKQRKAIKKQAELLLAKYNQPVKS
jgi:hypothetical protein